jgi:hypothetical protein
MENSALREINRLCHLERMAETYRTDDADELRLKRVEALEEGATAKLMAIGSRGERFRH